jgi:diguanylate cyclase (GGDEF)-like protein/PAS domain S-box-containing protein
MNRVGRAQVWLLLAVLASALGAALLLPAVLGGLAEHEAVRARLEHLQTGESRFRELVIRLRHGVTSNYDEANLWMSRIRADREALNREAAGVTSLRPLLARYEAAVTNQEAQWNDFKLRNAVVRNSLRYFQSDAVNFMRQLPKDTLGNTLHNELVALNNALFMQALGEGREVGEAAVATLEYLRPLAASLDQDLRLEFGRLSRHAEIIGHNSVRLEADIQGLIHGEGRDALAQLADANHALLIAEQTRAGRYRAGLLVAAVALLLALAVLAARYLDSLRQRAKDLALAGTVFENSQQGIVVTNREGAIVRANPAYCRMTGYSEAELLGRNPRILKSGLQDAAFYREMWKSLEDTGRWQGELRNRRKNGEHYVQWANIDAVQSDEASGSGEAGGTLYVGIASDISELVETRERLASLAYYDTLTGLPNRVLFHDRLRQALAQSRREKESLALIFADLDNFKAVNDTLGHAAGDELLMTMGERLKGCVRESDTVARLGGDEFAVILMDAKGPQEMARLAGNIVEALAAPSRVMGYEVTSGASLGITFYPNDGETPEELLKNADVAMYRAKERGRNNYQFFTGDMATGVAEALRIEGGLRRALVQGELALHYQPQIRTDTGVVAAEALMRWTSPELGAVPPSRFIPVAEKCGLITELGDFALHEACRQCAHWRESLDRHLRVAVNLSAAQFRDESLVDKVAAVLHEFSLPGSALELEITESVVMEDVARGQDVLRGLKALGCRLAIDDFGTGYSSLAYLKRFQVDVLKIDKSFVDGLGTEADDTAVAQAVISLARSLRLEVVAEGVETELQLRCLTELAGEEGFIAQGYLFAKPVSAVEFEAAFRALPAAVQERVREGGRA